MSLNPGSKLGPYEIVAPLGAGGMGEVYRAKDPRLGREVAVKVMPDLLMGDSEVRARFEREARAASALNHPNICQVYDVGREGDTDYIVMELIEGESLAQRLDKGPIATPELLRVGSQIADALDRAHRAGIIHRDLKPGNIMLTKQGAKLVDFGLARPTGLAGPGSGSRPGTPSSPTMSRPLTAAGSIVGTFMYMAPEQLEGAEADARSDIWALGATLYEMATGRPAFEGKSQASLIAAILGKEPAPIAELVPLAPPALERLVRACLAKDPEERVQTAHDVKLQLKWISEGGSQAGVPAPVAAHRKRRERLAWALAALFGAVAVGALAVLGVKEFGPKPKRQAIRFVVTSPPGMSGITWPRMSPDGTMLAFTARDTAGVVSIWVRPLSSTTAYQLQGTTATGRPFWSPDSKELGFFSDAHFKKVAAAGGPVQLVGESGNASDGAWSKDYVLFDAASGDSIRGIPVTGGPVVPMSTLDRSIGETQHAWPFALPDGKHFLFQAFRTGRGRTSLIRLGTFGTLKSIVVDSSASRAEFLPPDHLVYVKDGAVIARRFDVARAKVTGNPIVIGENAGSSVNTQAFSASSVGTVAFQRSSGGGASVIRRFDRTGKPLGDLTEPANLNGVALSPDGQRLAISMAETGSTKDDLWIRDLKRGTQTRFTFDPGDEVFPVWSPAGDTLAFASDRSGGYSVMVKPVSGVTEETSLPGLVLPVSAPIQYSADGRYLMIVTQGSDGPFDCWALPRGDAAHPIAIAKTQFSEMTPRLSPDGRFVAFSSTESGQPEIYAQAFPKANGRWQVSVNGGQHPFWTMGGKEIVFRGLSGDVMAVPVAPTPGGSLEPGNPVRLFGGVQGSAFPGRFVPALDGKEFLLIQSANAGRTELYPITVILDANADLQGK